MIVIIMFVVSKNETKQKQINNVVSLFYVELNGMHFVIWFLQGYMCILHTYIRVLVPASVAQWDTRLTGDQEAAGFDPRRTRQYSFVKIDHEIFSTVILSLLLIQEGQLSISAENMCTRLVYGLEDLACPRKVWLGQLVG